MTGQILIIDSQATNRIMLKAKLSAAFYIVRQAASVADAIKECVRDTPDLILLGVPPADMPVSELIARLEGACPAAPPPVLVLALDCDPFKRFTLLKAGATDVLEHPLDDDTLFARLRAIMRLRLAEGDLTRHLNRTDAPGFAEENASFTGSGRAVILSSEKAGADDLCKRLDLLCRHELLAFAYDEPEGLRHLSPAPDVVVLHISASQETAGLRCLAEWKAAPDVRNMRVIALLDDGVAHLAATALDLGACDAIASTGMDQELAYRLCQHMAHKKRSDSLRDRLENRLQAAVLDQLTGLHNRRYAHVFLRRMIDQACQSTEPCAIMLADIDHFKSVNDTYGHTAGDRVLVRLAKEMQAVVPPDALLARVGGEEFLIAIPAIGHRALERLAARLCRRVRDTRIDGSESIDGSGRDTIQVTISIGAMLVSNAAVSGVKPPCPEELIAQADQALYVSKSGGRDTVTLQFAA